MSAFVLDASFALQWVFEDEHSQAGYLALETALLEGVVVPGFWLVEMTNVLGMALRRGRIDLPGREKAQGLLSRLPLRVDGPLTLAWASSILDLMDRYRLTAYDATYLELARRLSLPLATFDRELRAAAPQAGVTLFNP